jgi:ubiquinol-cytochrome c reductase cytochrome b subunit
MGILLLITLILFVMSGYLLPWDQWAYWNTAGGIDRLETIPIVGGLVAQLLRADEFVSGATLSRYYATHVILLPWVLLLLLSLHFQLVRKHGVAPIAGTEDEDGEPFYPNHMLRQLVVVFVTLMVLITLAAFFPRPFGAPADPFSVPDEMPALGLPTAIIVGAASLPAGLGLIVLILLFLALAVLPLVEGSTETAFSRRPFAMGLFLVFVLFLLVSLGAGLSLGARGLAGGN